MVDDIEPRDRRVRPDIDLCQPLSIPDDKLPPILQDLLQLVQSLEQFGDGLGVRLDLGREPGTVDAIVDLRVDPFVELVDLFLEVGRVEVELGLLPRKLLVECLFERRSRPDVAFRSDLADPYGDISMTQHTVLKNLMISLLSFETIVLCLVSQTTGTMSPEQPSSISPAGHVQIERESQPTGKPRIVLYPTQRYTNRSATTTNTPYSRR